MDTKSVSFSESDDQIDLKEMFCVLWSNKIKIIIFTAIFAVGSVFYALSLPNQYKATVLLAPAQSDGSGLSDALGQLGSLASLAGVSVGGGKSSESQIALEIMKSWSFIETFIVDNNLAVTIWAATGWNQELNKLEINQNVFDEQRNLWLIEDSSGKKGPPSSWKLFQKFSGIFDISEDKKLGLVSVSVEHYSPQLAKSILDSFVSAINKHMQNRKVNQVSKNIEYLEAQIERTAIAEMREVFYRIIEEQTKNKMVAEASPNYAFVPVSPSMIPEQRSKPTRSTICILITLFGGVLSVMLVLVTHYTRGFFKN